MKTLSGRMLDIAIGRTELPIDKVVSYRELWKSQGYSLPLLKDRRASQSDCEHRGDVLRSERCVLCPASGDSLEVPVYSCAMHGECTARKVSDSIQACSKCYEWSGRTPKSQLDVPCNQQPFSHMPFPSSVVRNLMMYIYPIAQHEVWRWNVEQIKRRLPLFNGKRIITISQDFRTNDASEVINALGEHNADRWIVVANDPSKWEMMGLPIMMEHCHSCDPNEITFYCHGKGVQGPAHVTDPMLLEQPRIKWATVMYESCLDYMPLVERSLETNVFAGSFKRRMVVANLGPHRSSWHFAGTFYWFRNAKLFGIPSWSDFNHSWFGAETYPGQLVGWYQAAGLFGDHAPIQYLQEAWTGEIEPAWAAWKEANKEYHRPCTVPS